MFSIQHQAEAVGFEYNWATGSLELPDHQDETPDCCELCSQPLTDGDCLRCEISFTTPF